MNTVLGATVPYKENIYVASATIVDISRFYLNNIGEKTP